MKAVRVAAVQLCSGSYGPDSLDDAVTRAAAAAEDADVVCLPESYAGFGDLDARRPWAFDPAAPHEGRTVAPFVALSRSSQAAFILGGTPEHAPDGRTFNTAAVVRAGKVLATYRKERLFDADLPDGTTLRESRQTAAGAPGQNVVVDLGGARFGLSICFDLRFGAHYADLRSAGAEVLLVPSAFTRPTGAAHWSVLLRARAIETQCFVIAPAQCGDHGNGRASWGHSLIVDPWGTVLADAGDVPSVAVAELDPAALANARARFGASAPGHAFSAPTT